MIFSWLFPYNTEVCCSPFQPLDAFSLPWHAMITWALRPANTAVPISLLVLAQPLLASFMLLCQKSFWSSSHCLYLFPPDIFTCLSLNWLNFSCQPGLCQYLANRRVFCTHSIWHTHTSDWTSWNNMCFTSCYRVTLYFCHIAFPFYISAELRSVNGKVVCAILHQHSLFSELVSNVVFICNILLYIFYLSIIFPVVANTGYTEHNESEMSSSSSSHDRRLGCIAFKIYGDLFFFFSYVFMHS